MNPVTRITAWVGPLLLLLPATGEQKRNRPQPVPAKLFEKAAAKRVIRGRIRPVFMEPVLDRTFHWRTPGIVVFIEGAEKRWRFPVAARAVRISIHEDGRVVPATICVRAGQRVVVQNAHPNAMLSRWKTQGRRSKGSIASLPQGRHTFSFDAGESVSILTAGFPSMFRTPIRVFAHPLFAVVDSDGEFALPAVPDGKYVVTAVHQTLGVAQVKLEIKGKQPKPITSLFTAPTKVKRSRSSLSRFAPFFAEFR